MAGKGVRVEIHRTNVKRLDDDAARALAMAADATLTDILEAQVIPFDYGTMQNDQTFADTSAAKQGSASIVTSALQAARLYFHPEYDFQTANNANAQAAWFEDWITGKKKEFTKKAFARFMSKFMGG